MQPSGSQVRVLDIGIHYHMYDRKQIIPDRLIST